MKPDIQRWNPYFSRNVCGEKIHTFFYFYYFFLRVGTLILWDYVRSYSAKYNLPDKAIPSDVFTNSLENMSTEAKNVLKRKQFPIFSNSDLDLGHPKLLNKCIPTWCLQAGLLHLMFINNILLETEVTEKSIFFSSTLVLTTMTLTLVSLNSNALGNDVLWYSCYILNLTINKSKKIIDIFSGVPIASESQVSFTLSLDWLY